jgi:1-acyl-sn-glycerol-3-phosphate acyltransferase
MLSFLPHWLRGSTASLLIILNTALVFVPMNVVALLKLAIPVAGWRKLCTRVIMAMATYWVSANGFFFRLLHRIEWNIQLPEGLRTDAWYLVTCNHRSWSDIPVVQYALNGRVPFLKFFLKQQLIWVPLLGICWWALDFPFMKRYTKAQIEKDPSLKGKDLETTRRACEKFRHTPVAVFNFIEGTRFTRAKHDRQQSPYTDLLLPRAGGVGFVLGAMGDRLDTMLDLTLFYPDGDPTFWDLLSGRMPRVVVHGELRPIPAHFLGRDYLNDEAFRDGFQAWVRDRWTEKDALLESMRARYAAQGRAN